MRDWIWVGCGSARRACCQRLLSASDASARAERLAAYSMPSKRQRTRTTLLKLPRPSVPSSLNSCLPLRCALSAPAAIDARSAAGPTRMRGRRVAAVGRADEAAGRSAAGRPEHAELARAWRQGGAPVARHNRQRAQQPGRVARAIVAGPVRKHVARGRRRQRAPQLARGRRHGSGRHCVRGRARGGRAARARAALVCLAGLALAALAAPLGVQGAPAQACARARAELGVRSISEALGCEATGGPWPARTAGPCLQGSPQE